MNYDNTDTTINKPNYNYTKHRISRISSILGHPSANTRHFMGRQMQLWDTVPNAIHFWQPVAWNGEIGMLTELCSDMAEVAFMRKKVEYEWVFSDEITFLDEEHPGVVV